MARKITLLTHHKCGSTWVGWLINTVCELNGWTCFRSHLGNAIPSGDHDVSVLTNARYEIVREHIGPNTLHVVRNPLSILLSAYHSHLKTHPLENWPELKKQRSVLMNVSREEGVLLTLAFIESDHFYNNHTPGPLFSLRSWQFEDQRFHTIRMEDIVTNVGDLLDRFAGAVRDVQFIRPIAEQFAFESFTGRKPSIIDEDSHYRSGSADGWRKELPKSAVSYIRAHYNDVLTKFYPEALS